MASTKTSPEGRSLIKQAIAKKGWRVRDDRWLVAASYLLEPDGDWRPDGPYAYGCSMQTWERFLQGVAIRDRSFIAFCTVLNLQPSQVADSDFLKENDSIRMQETAGQIYVAAREEPNLSSAQALLSRILSLESRMNHLEAWVESQS